MSVYLFDLNTQTILHTFLLTGYDSRGIVWDENSSKMYVATGN